MNTNAHSSEMKQSPAGARNQCDENKSGRKRGGLKLRGGGVGQGHLAQIWHKCGRGCPAASGFLKSKVKETLDSIGFDEGGEWYKKMERAKGFEPSTFTLAT